MSNYWAERQKQLNNQLEKDEKKLKEKLSAEYEKEAKKLEKEIAAYYKTYGEADVIEYRTLLQSLSSADRQLLMERMDDFAAKYPQYAHLMPVRESIYKLDRLEGLQASIRMQQLQIGAVENDLISNHLLKTAQRGANNAAEAMGFGKNFYSLNSEILKTTINKGWANEKNFSDRIWDNRQKLADYLCNDFASAIVRGDSYQKCVNELTDRFVNVSKNNAFRLVYTEGTYISNESQSKVFEDYYEQYRFNTIDGNACKNCKGINQKVFDFKDRQPGLNFPPLHSWCRCYFTVEIEDSEKWMDDYVAKKQGEAVEKSAESGIIKENVNNFAKAPKASEIFNFSESIGEVSPQAIVDALENSDIGQKTLKMLIEKGVKPILDYSEKTFSYRGEQQGKTIKIYMKNIPNVKVAAQTVIHETTHLYYDIGQCQWAEAVCFAREKMFLTGRSLTIQEKRYIVKLAKQAYPEFNWKKGGYGYGKR